MCGCIFWHHHFLKKFRVQARQAWNLTLRGQNIPAFIKTAITHRIRILVFSVCQLYGWTSDCLGFIGTLKNLFLLHFLCQLLRVFPDSLGELGHGVQHHIVQHHLKLFTHKKGRWASSSALHSNQPAAIVSWRVLAILKQFFGGWGSVIFQSWKVKSLGQTQPNNQSSFMENVF